MRCAAVVAAIALLFGCSDSTEPSFPDAKGRYDGEWVFVYSGGSIPPASNTCLGHLTIANQTDSSISGEAVLGSGQGCTDEPGPVSGTITTGGEVTLNVSELDAYVANADCVGSTVFKGSLAGNRLTFARGPLECDGGAFLESSFTGTR